jgi:hypothetical protein
VTLPSDLLKNASDRGGGKIVLVLGAGTSLDAPTSLKAGAGVSMEAHSRLVADSVIKSGELTDTWNLPLLADLVYAKFGIQKELTDRLPYDRWRLAKPNAGHKEAAALLVEGVVRTILTVNFDLSQQSAIGEIESDEAPVAIVRGPEATPDLSGRSLVYLHRSCEADPEEWILRGTHMADPSLQPWEVAIADSILMAPVVVFVGLGSEARVLSQTTARLASNPNSKLLCYWVDPCDPGDFYNSLGGNAIHIRMTWPEFTSALGSRIREDVVGRIICHAISRLDSFGVTATDLPMCREALLQVPFHELGRRRSAWLLRDNPYSIETQLDSELLGELMAAAWVITEALGAQKMTIDRDGLLQIETQSGNRIPLRMASSAGLRSWSAVATRLLRERGEWPGQAFRAVLLSHQDIHPDLAPVDLVRDGDPVDLIRGADQLIAIGTTEAITLSTTNVAALKERLSA